LAKIFSFLLFCLVLAKEISLFGLMRRPSNKQKESSCVSALFDYRARTALHPLPQLRHSRCVT